MKIDSIPPGSAQKFIDSGAEFADNLVNQCRDRYGEKETPLLSDGINLKTGEPIKWKEHTLSNLACQQNFLRTLDGLTAKINIPEFWKVWYNICNQKKKSLIKRNTKE